MVDFNELATEMADADYVMHIDEAIYDTNDRLREQVNRCFDKLDLTPHEIHLFEKWHLRLSALPMNTSRLDIFLCSGSLEVLTIVGL